MDSINIKLIHPTNNSDIDVGLPMAMLFREWKAQIRNNCGNM